MTRSELVGQYVHFFKSEGGLDLMKEIDRQIRESHEKAEQDPDHARDFVLTARAARELKSHIERMSVDAKKVNR